MCIDYRRLNSRTKKDSYPIPLIDDCLRMCKDAKWLTLIDVKDAFHHIPMEESSIPLTAFVTPDGLFEWLRMPFGLTNAPATFQRYIDFTLRPIIGKSCAAFFDDVLVYSKDSLEDHIKDVQRALELLYNAGLSAKISKCKFAHRELIFVGHLIRDGKIYPNPEKIEAVTKFPVPTTVTHVKSFLGLVNYYRRFIRGFAQIATPLYSLLKKDSDKKSKSKGTATKTPPTPKGTKSPPLPPLNWTASAQHAFEELKKALTTAPCLHSPDFSKPFILQTDASGDGIAAVLVQIGDDGEEHPVGYVSRQLNVHEANYSATEWECLAVVWGIKQFSTFLQDSAFKVVTDHAALQWLPTKKFDNARLMRWSMLLSDYKYTVEHRKGKSNANADALSRCPVPNSAPAEDQIVVIETNHSIQLNHQTPNYVRFVAAVGTPAPTNVAASSSHSPHLHTLYNFSNYDDYVEIAKAQHAEPDYKKYIDYLLSNNKRIPMNLSAPQIATFKAHAEEYMLDRTCSPPALLYSGMKVRNPLPQLYTDYARLVIPPKFRVPLLELYHNSLYGAHTGIVKTIARVSNHYWWMGMAKDIQTYISNCIPCQQAKKQHLKIELERSSLPTPTEPFDFISMDFIGPFDSSKVDGYKYILVIVDHYTRWCIAVPTKSTESIAVSHALRTQVISTFGPPRRILTDRASSFESDLYHSLCKRFGIHKLRTTSFHPQCNGLVERVNGTLKQTLTAFALNPDYQSTWVDDLPFAVYAYNTTPSDLYKVSPYTLLFHREPRLPFQSDYHLAFDTDYNSSSPIADQSWLSAARTDQLIRQILDSKVLANAKSNSEMNRIRTFNVGDLVMRTIEDQRIKIPGSPFRAAYAGPFRIAKCISPTNYIIENLHYPGQDREIMHTHRLRIYNQSTDTLSTTQPLSQAVAPSLPHSQQHIPKPSSRTPSTSLRVPSTRTPAPSPFPTSSSPSNPTPMEIDSSSTILPSVIKSNGATSSNPHETRHRHDPYRPEYNEAVMFRPRDREFLPETNRSTR